MSRFVRVQVLPFLLSFFQFHISPVAAQSQSLDGSNNNPFFPTRGAVNDAFLRLVPSGWSNGTTDPLYSTYPSPRNISINIFGNHEVRAPRYNTLNVSDFVATWGLLLQMDMTKLDVNASDVYNISIPPSDPYFGSTTTTMPFARSAFSGANAFGNRNYLNAYSAAIDGSFLYGLSNTTLQSFRTGRKGLFKCELTSLGEFFPTNATNPKFFSVPFFPIHHTPMTMAVATLLFREHNRKALEVSVNFPSLTDEEVFQQARRWVIAIIQKITADYFIPAVTGMKLPFYNGYDPSVNHQVDLFFSAVAFRFGHNTINEMTLRLSRDGSAHPSGPIINSDALFNMRYVRESGIEPIIRGMLTQNVSDVDEAYSASVLNRLTYYSNPYDLVAVDIQRARELGIPTYNDARTALNLSRATKWGDISSSTYVQDLLASFYGTVDQVEAYVGAQLEDHVPGGIVGPLMAASLIDQFTRSRNGDGHWFENTNRTGMSNTDLSLIRRLNITALFVRNSNGTSGRFPDNPFRSVSPLYWPDALPKSVPVPTLRITDDILLSWNVSDNLITIRAFTNLTTWFAVGLNGFGMNQANLHVCHNPTGNQWIVQNFRASGYSPAPVANSTMISFRVTNGSEMNSFRLCEFTRPLQDNSTLLTGEIGIVCSWAASPSDTILQYHGPNRTVMTANFMAPFGQNTSGNSTVLVSSAFNPTIYYLHGCLLVLSFGFAIPLAIFIARYNRDFGPFSWVVIHQAIMMMAVAQSIMSAMMAYTKGVDSGTSLSSIHSYVGYILSGLMCVTAALGSCRSMKLEFLAPYAQYISFTHKLLGYATFCLGVLQSVFGFQGFGLRMSGDPGYTWIIYLTGVALLVIILAVFGEVSSRGILLQSRDSINRKDVKKYKVPRFTWDEFLQRVDAGEKWVVVKGGIIDVTGFLKTHPGGSKLLLEHIGLDVTDIFLGGENGLNGTNHKHSALAMVTLREHLVGRLPQGDSLLHVSSPDAESGNSQLQEKPKSSSKVSSMVRYIRTRSPRPRIGTIVSADVISSPLARNPVKCFQIQIPSDTPDLQAEVAPLAGDVYEIQYLVTEEFISRSYTLISNNQGCLEFYIKIYQQPQEGIVTNYLNSLEPDSLVRIRGPIRNFNVYSHKSHGCWDYALFVVGGTAINSLFQVAQHHFAHGPKDEQGKPKWKICVIFCIHSMNEVYALNALEQLVNESQGAIQILYHPSHVDKEWRGPCGRLAISFLRPYLPSADIVQKSFKLQKNVVWTTRTFTSSEGVGQHEGPVPDEHDRFTAVSPAGIVSPMSMDSTSVMIHSHTKSPSNTPQVSQVTAEKMPLLYPSTNSPPSPTRNLNQSTPDMLLDTESSSIRAEMFFLDGPDAFNQHVKFMLKNDGTWKSVEYIQSA